MAVATWLTQVVNRHAHGAARAWMGSQQALSRQRVMAHVGRAGQANADVEHNPFSLLGAYDATPIRKLNEPGFFLSSRAE